MQMQNMEKEINQSDESRPTLPCVATIASKLVLATVRSPRSCNPDADDGVENKRRENQAPLDQRKQFPGLWIKKTARWKVSVPFSKLAFVARCTVMYKPSGTIPNRE